MIVLKGDIMSETEELDNFTRNNRARAAAQLKIFLGINEHQERRQAWVNLAEQVIPDDDLDNTRGAISKLAKMGQVIADIFMKHPDKVAYHIKEILKLGE